MRALLAVSTALAITSTSACDRRPERATFRDPQSQLSMTIEREPMHAYLAEYHRTLLIDVGSETISRIDLFDDTGGYSRTNLYNLADGGWLARDAEASYTIDNRGRVSKDEGRRRSGVFVGSFDTDDAHRWRFLAAAERGEVPTEFSGAR